MSAHRLPSALRRRHAERRRVESFLAAIRATAPAGHPAPVSRPIPLPNVEPVPTPRGVVWQLDEASRAHLEETRPLPLGLVRLMVQP